MKIDKNTKVLQLLEQHPNLLDVLVGVSPEFKKLQNPLLRKTIGRFATLGHAADTSGIPFEELERRITEAMIHAPAEDEEKAPMSPEERAERIVALTDIVRGLHEGRSPEEQKARFAGMLKEVSASEIAEMEQALMAEGISEEEIKKLCDVHVQVFAESFEGGEPPRVPAGHPVDTFQKENAALGEVADRIRFLLEELSDPPDGDTEKKWMEELKNLFKDLSEIEKHYLRKENQLFPMLEKHGITGPSKVMWALHDDIRSIMKEVLLGLEEGEKEIVIGDGTALVTIISDMIYKEENILFPMAMETLSESDWGRVLEGSEELGFALIEPATGWQPAAGPLSEAPPPRPGGGEAPLWLFWDAGVLHGTGDSTRSRKWEKRDDENGQLGAKSSNGFPEVEHNSFAKPDQETRS